ncbi:2-phosphosulfolactate phosphatase [Microbacterium betulae]|uniref:Probable 2-phosphosulfolactate phosphatase n=1 Tax=Microbacterium betulae TaxID=2981139 RepID=A0AA97FGV5_9MICO|nr:2-phosphosulfolactate phosphatase [Microbacterium sp. AB]WOF22428.1 2-phosphosulfolactate phosphatase [Microbacterium sp. AB]
MTSPFDQSSYQVRFDWGVDGLRRLASSDVVVVVDVIGFSSDVIATVARGETAATTEAGAVEGAVVAQAAAALAHGPVVLAGALRNAAAVARAVMAEQERRGARTSVAVVAAGEADAAADGRERFAVEDLLGAGAIVAALSDLGVDHSSPEAVATAESFRALRRAVRHLMTASGSGRALEGGPRHAEVHAAARVDDLDVVPVLREGVFAAR